MKSIFLVILAFFVVCVTSTVIEVYGHGVGPTLSTGIYRVEDETFSKTAVSVGESLFINGTIMSLVERDIQGNIDIKFDYANTDSWFINILKSNFSCLAQDTCAKRILVPNNQNHWYVDIKSEPDVYVLKGNGVISYSIEVIPLKAGIYHIHTDPNADIDSFRRIGAGETIMVEGLQDITEGEMFEFYIPYTAGFVLMIIGLGYGIIFMHRRKQRKRK